MMPERVFLIGFMGAGKSTVGRLLADRLGFGFVDLDAAIEARSGRSIAEIFAEDGEPAFRAMEHEALLEYAGLKNMIVACGGGVVVDHANRAVLRESGTVVYLRVTAEEALARIGDRSTRPLLSATGGGEIAATMLLRARSTLYSSTADITIDTVGSEPEAIVERVSEALEEIDR